MDDFFEFLGYVGRRLSILYDRIQRYIREELVQRYVAPRRPISPTPRRLVPSARKKFQILDQATQQPALNLTKVRRTSRLNNITETRPQKCPRCLTRSEIEPTNITKLNGQWFCKKCTNRW